MKEVGLKRSWVADGLKLDQFGSTEPNRFSEYISEGRPVFSHFFNFFLFLLLLSHSFSLLLVHSHEFSGAVVGRPGRRRHRVGHLNPPFYIIFCSFSLFSSLLCYSQLKIFKTFTHRPRSKGESNYLLCVCVCSLVRKCFWLY
jgi:hypothetical protein